MKFFLAFAWGIMNLKFVPTKVSMRKLFAEKRGSMERLMNVSDNVDEESGAHRLSNHVIVVRLGFERVQTMILVR